jgi:hypothetical protein
MDLALQAGVAAVGAQASGDVNPPVTARNRAASAASTAYEVCHRPIDIARSPSDIFQKASCCASGL